MYKNEKRIFANGLIIKEIDTQKDPKPDASSNKKCRGTYCNGYGTKINIEPTHKTIVIKNLKTKSCFENLKVFIVIL
jgi:hypothetical protein